MIVSALRKLVDGDNLSTDEAYDVMCAIMEGEVTHTQIGGLLTALRIKGETVDELTGFARAMRSKSLTVESKRTPLVDTVGTGGDKLDTFNVSTTAAFVVAAAGVAVAQHGNRAVTSQCGSADVLQALGVELSISPQDVGECIDTVGVGFLYAPKYHPAMKHAAQPRKELGIRTVFNVLGPLTNPTNAQCQVIGVYDQALCAKLAEALLRLGCERAMVVHGLDGLDEISTLGPTCISHLNEGRVHTEAVTPEELGVATARLTDISGSNTAEGSAAIVRRILQGEPGARRDIVCVNAAAGLIVGGVAKNWADGQALARAMIDNGRAERVLNRLVEFTQMKKLTQ